MEPSATEVAAFCREHFGSALRTVVAYDAEEFETGYVREDLAAGYDHRRFAALVAVARDVHGPLRALPDGSTDSPTGAYRSTRHRFENAVALQFVVDDTRGYLVSVEREAARRLDDLTDPLLRVVGRAE